MKEKPMAIIIYNDTSRDLTLSKNISILKLIDENINITPHIASTTHPTSVASQIIENYDKISKGLEPSNKINRDKGY